MAGNRAWCMPASGLTEIISNLFSGLRIPLGSVMPRKELTLSNI